MGMIARESAGPVQDVIQPIIHKAAVRDLCVTVNRTGLSIGDKVELRLTEDGQVAVYGWVKRRILVVTRRRLQKLGSLGPHACHLLEYGLRRGDYMRVRIVGMTPEHLAPDGRAEIDVSVWGQIRNFRSPINPVLEAPLLP